MTMTAVQQSEEARMHPRSSHDPQNKSDVLHPFGVSARLAFVTLLILCGLVPVFAGASAEGSTGRGSYLAAQGQIIPPDEVVVGDYVASVDYLYPPSSSPIGIYPYAGNRTVSSTGGTELLQIGVQGQRQAFDDLPPLNLAFVIDVSGSMEADNKLEWVKESFEVLLGRVRSVDYLSLVIFNEAASAVFPSERMSTAAVRERFANAVRILRPGGGTNLNAGLEQGYLAVQANYRSDYTNRVLFLTDGVGDSDRLLDMARSYRELGINVSTIGVGDGFDLDLMSSTARAGGGSARFIASREEMQSIFNDELDRMVVLAARDVELTVELGPGVVCP